MLLLCSFFRLKELFQEKNGVTTSLLFSFFLKVPKIWIGRTTVNGEKKRGWPLIRWFDSIHLVTFSLRKLLIPPLVSPRNDYKDGKRRQKFCHTDDVSLPTSVQSWRSSASDWLKRISLAARPIGGTIQIWVGTRHQNGISSVVTQTSSGGGSVVSSRNVGCSLSLGCIFNQQVLLVFTDGMLGEDEEEHRLEAASRALKDSGILVQSINIPEMEDTVNLMNLVEIASSDVYVWNEVDNELLTQLKKLEREPCNY